MIIVVGGIKGGSGKTTIATNLTAMRAVSKKVLLVDADEQKSAWYWSQQRDVLLGADIKSRNSFATLCLSGKSLYSTLIRMQDDYDDIIIDTGGRDTTSQRAALCLADKLLLPFKPSSIDIWTLGFVKGILDECINPKMKSYAFICQADPGGHNNQEALQILDDFEYIETLHCIIGNRKVFRNAAAEGLGVHELKPADKKAQQEMKSLYDEIYI